MHDDLGKLNDAIHRSDEILSRAEKAGMEVGEAKLALAAAQDNLTKARVTIHSVRPEAVDQEIKAGLKITDNTWQQGHSAMTELKYRREGLLVSIAAIVLVLIGLGLFIRRIESGQTGKENRQ